jgi:DNA mismatch endonuclease (patch repair protein)
MAAIRGVDTRPEIRVRKLLHRLGYRFRLHRRDLPGKPDIVLPKYRAVIFVHGCFWHSHSCRYGAVKPATRSAFWSAKRTATVERDQKKAQALLEQGWHVLTFWECETKDSEDLGRRLSRLLKQIASGSVVG